MTPLGHRVLIRPDEEPAQAGAILLLEHQDFVATSGTVVALGPGGSRVRYQARQRAIADAAEWIDRQGYGRLAAGLRSNFAKSADWDREIAVGDRVAFAAESGVAISKDGEPYLLIEEDDLIVLVEEAVA